MILNENINFKKLLIFILVTILVGSLFSFFINNSIYNNLLKPNIIPQGYIFIIVWLILYTLMGISFYLISESYGNKNKAYLLYLLQLIVNSLWTLFFFKFDLRLFSFIWIIILIILVILMLIEFLKLNKLSAYLQIPYLIWLFIASYFNLSIYLLNS